MFVCVVPLSQPSSRDLVYPLLGCFVSEEKQYKKKLGKQLSAMFPRGDDNKRKKYDGENTCFQLMTLLG